MVKDFKTLCLQKYLLFKAIIFLLVESNLFTEGKHSVVWSKHTALLLEFVVIEFL